LSGPIEPELFYNRGGVGFLIDGLSKIKAGPFFDRLGLASKVKVRLRDLIVGAKDRIISALSEAFGRLRALEGKAATSYLVLRLEFEKRPRLNTFAGETREAVRRHS